MQELRQWLTGIDGFAKVDIAPASGDASFRRYFRATTKDGTFIVMDAPPENEDSERFVRIAGYLRQMSLTSPAVLHSDLRSGFLLLSDLGSQHYLDELICSPARAEELYGAALDALLKMQRAGRHYQQQLPPYDEKLLRYELSIFKEWLCERHLGIAFEARALREWQDCCDVLVQNALKQPRVFVHRDYHSRNLMLMPANNPGILDFQDALEGPLTYDLVSLLKDCYLSWTEEQVRTWALEFHARLDDHERNSMSSEEFMRTFELMGAQRHLKAAGIFTRLLHRDGKPSYISDVPRTLNYVVDLAPRQQSMNFMATFIADRCLPLLQDMSE